MIEKARIALVHDYLVQNGGAEKVLECLCDIFPDAPIYTLVYSKKLMHGAFSGKDIRTSFLQKVPLAAVRHRIFPQFMPFAIEQFDFSKYDLVISDSSSFAKGIITGPETLHICYMHTPMRFAWDDCQKYTSDFYYPNFIKKAVPFFMNYIRVWDKISAERPDRIIANSSFIAKRIKKYYRRDCDGVIHPPIDTERFYVSPKKNYFVASGRHMAYKRFDIVVEAFNRLGLNLKVIGRGPETKRLKKMAAKNIEFLGRVSDEELMKYFSGARALIFPQEEDFGITAIEAMASGTPIIAYRGGDIPEHMGGGKAGLLFDRQAPEAIIEAVLSFKDADFDSNNIRQQALKFDKAIFKDKMREYIEKEYKRFKNNPTN